MVMGIIVHFLTSRRGTKGLILETESSSEDSAVFESKTVCYVEAREKQEGDSVHMRPAAASSASSLAAAAIYKGHFKPPEKPSGFDSKSSKSSLGTKSKLSGIETGWTSALRAEEMKQDDEQPKPLKAFVSPGEGGEKNNAATEVTVNSFATEASAMSTSKLSALTQDRPMKSIGHKDNRQKLQVQVNVFEGDRETDVEISRKSLSSGEGEYYVSPTTNVTRQPNSNV